MKKRRNSRRSTSPQPEISLVACLNWEPWVVESTCSKWSKLGWVTLPVSILKKIIYNHFLILFSNADTTYVATPLTTTTTIYICRYIEATFSPYIYCWLQYSTRELLPTLAKAGRWWRLQDCFTILFSSALSWLLHNCLDDANKQSNA